MEIGVTARGGEESRRFGCAQCQRARARQLQQLLLRSERCTRRRAWWRAPAPAAVDYSSDPERSDWVCMRDRELLNGDDLSLLRSTYTHVVVIIRARREAASGAVRGAAEGERRACTRARYARMLGVHLSSHPSPDSRSLSLSARSPFRALLLFLFTYLPASSPPCSFPSDWEPRNTVPDSKGTLAYPAYFIEAKLYFRAD